MEDTVRDRRLFPGTLEKEREIDTRYEVRQSRSAFPSLRSARRSRRCCTIERLDYGVRRRAFPRGALCQELTPSTLVLVFRFCLFSCDSFRRGCGREHGGDRRGVRQDTEAVQGIAGRPASRTGPELSGGLFCMSSLTFSPLLPCGRKYVVWCWFCWRHCCCYS